MRLSTLRWIILVTTFSTAVLVAAQLFWLNKIYNYEQKQFTTDVVNSIQGLYEDVQLLNSPTTQLQKLIEKPDVSTFLFKVETNPNRDTLIDYLVANLEDYSIYTDCRLALYNNLAHNYLFDIYVPAAASRHDGKTASTTPSFNRNYNYVCLYFPHLYQYIISSMKWWIASSIFVLLVLVALGLSIFYLYKQKFLNEIQNDFIQNVTHEFQTPLTTLIVGLDTLAKPAVADNNDKLRKYVHLMQTQTNYLKHHIENLMKVLKAEGTGLIMHKEWTSPNDLIRRAVDQLQAFAEEKNAVIELNLEPTNTSIKADGDNLFVSILNVISNALKYSEHPEVDIVTETTNNKYLIIIRDNGIGIDEKAKKKLFKKFYRVPSGNIHNVKGLGLGLYFVKKVVDGHAGTIQVKSAAGKGATFIIELPVQ